MITCKLQGGLGNQMFQIATTYATSKKNNVEYNFDFNHCFTPNQGNPSKKYEDNIFKLVNNTLNINEFKKINIYNEPNFSYNEIPKNNNLYLEGFFQSEKYFKKYEEDVRRLFFFSEEEINKVENFIKNSGILTSIHVRRGDYLKHSEFHPTCSVEYYKKAMNIIGNSNFVFISDDMDWCKENFKGKNITYSSLTNEVEDLLLMSMCNNQIISNSSFSWWGAWVSRNNGMKIAPTNWFGPKGPSDQTDVIPEKWTRI